MFGIFIVLMNTKVWKLVWTKEGGLYPYELGLKRILRWTRCYRKVGAASHVLFDQLFRSNYVLLFINNLER